MNTKFRLFVCFCILALSSTAVSHATALTSWISTGASSTVSGLTTNSPVLGDGSAGSATNTAIQAYIGTIYTLSDIGNTLTFSGQFTLTGVDTLSGGWFKLGIFNCNGVYTGKNNWDGLMVQNSNGSSVGSLLRKTNPNTAWWSSSTGVATLQQFTATDNGVFDAGTYTFSMSLTNTAANTLTVNYTINALDGTYLASQTYVYASPVTLSYNMVGLTDIGGLASQISFSNLNIAYSAVPEPSTLMLGFAGFIGILSGSRRLRRLL